MTGMHHPWALSPKEAITLQKELRQAIVTDRPVSVDRANLIAGVDVSASQFDPMLTAGIIVWDRLSGQLVDSVSARTPSPFPYIPGLLSFREIPVLFPLVQQLSVVPDVWMVDGQGIAHPRRMGIAAHLGLLLDRPTIGVAKSRLFGTHTDVPEVAGSSVPLMDADEQIGVVLRSKFNSNPLYISPGHNIDVASSEAIVKSALRGYRLPEPTRLAHLFVNEVRKSSTAEPVLL